MEFIPHHSAENPAPVYRSTAGCAVAKTRSACSAARTSDHSSADRSGVPSAAHGTSVQVVVTNESPMMVAGSDPAEHSVAAAAIAAHQSSGDCSAQPFCGQFVG